MINQILTTFTQNNEGLGTGLMLMVLITMFIALFFWAWSDRRKPTFERAGQLPLEEDEPLEQHHSTTDSTAVDEPGQNPPSHVKGPVIIHTDGLFTRSDKSEKPKTKQ